MITSKIDTSIKQTAAPSSHMSGPEMSSAELQLCAVRLATLRRGRGIGAMFLAGFGTWWLAAGMRAAFGDNVLMLAAIIATGSILFLVGLYHASGKVPETSDPGYLAEQTRRNLVFRNVNIAQWLAIPLAVMSLNALGKGEWAIPAIILIVGIHFFPLAKLFASRANAWTGVAMVLIALVYPFLTAQGPSNPVGAIVTGLVLWANASYSLISLLGKNRTV